MGDKAKGQNKARGQKEPKAQKAQKDEVRPHELRQQALGGR